MTIDSAELVFCGKVDRSNILVIVRSTICIQNCFLTTSLSTKDTLYLCCKYKVYLYYFIRSIW